MESTRPHKPVTSLRDAAERRKTLCHKRCGNTEIVLRHAAGIIPDWEQIKDCLMQKRLYLTYLLDNPEVYYINTSLSNDCQANKQGHPLDTFLFKPSANPPVTEVSLNMPFQHWTAGVTQVTGTGLR